jgi:CDP-diglyceride synthetase
MRDLPRRTVTAVFYGAVLLGALVLPGPPFTLVVLALFVLGLWELWQLARGLPVASRRIFAFVLGLIVLAAGLFSLLFLTSYVQGQGEVVAPGAPFWAGMNRRPWVLLAMLPTWAADVSAYVVGSLIGRRKLAPRISPGKTWEGTIAGLLAAAAVAWFVAAEIFSPSLPAETIIFVALASGPAALMGDLLESALKRAAGVKDSGTLFPGHGGVLDRIDSLLLVSPVVAAALIAYRSGMIGL